GDALGHRDEPGDGRAQDERTSGQQAPQAGFDPHRHLTTVVLDPSSGRPGGTSLTGVTSGSPLARRLTTPDAVVIGLGSMVGAGLFAAFAPAAGAAGAGLLLGLALAAGVAFCNATASAQLAAQYP